MNEISINEEQVNQEMLNQGLTIKPVLTYQNIPRLVAIVAFICLSPLYYGWCLNQTSAISRTIFKQYFGPISAYPVTFAALVGIMPAGGGLGALSSPFIMKLIPGRKNFLLTFNVLAIIVACVIQIRLFPVLMTCRFLQGFIVGNYMGCVPSYIKQLTPVPLRGKIGSMSQLAIVGGYCFIFAFQIIFVDTGVNSDFFWRFMVSFSGVFAFIQALALAFNFVPQSPLSFIQNGDIEKARKILTMFNVLSAANQIIQDYLRIVTVKNQALPTKQIQMEERRRTSKLSNLSQIKRREKDKIPIIVYILAFQMPLMQQFTGNKTVATQVGLILQPINATMALYAPLILNIIQLISTAGSTILLTKFGRRPIILTGNILLAVIDIIIAIFFFFALKENNDSLVFGALGFFAIFMIIFGLTAGPTVWLYVPEIIPPRICPFATFSFWFGVTFSVTITPIVISIAHSAYPLFFLYGGVSFILFIFNYIFAIETNDQKKKK